MNMTGRTILITGGSSGIGLELARQLIARKNTVLITGRDERKLAAAKAALPTVITFASDVTDPKAIAALFATFEQQFPKVDVLINNAGIMRFVNLLGMTQSLSSEIEINLVAPMVMVETFLPLLRRQAEAAIVNVTSGLAFVPFVLSPIYSASKAGLHAYTQALRVQLEGSTIAVVELAPPATTTPLIDAFPPGLVNPSMDMKVEKLVAAAIRGLEKKKTLILPGAALILRLLSRLMPRFSLLPGAGRALLTSGTATTAAP